MFVYRPTSAFVCQRLTAPLAAGWDLPPDPPEPPLHPLKGENILALHKFLTRFQTADKSQLFSAPTARRPARQRRWITNLFSQNRWLANDPRCSRDGFLSRSLADVLENGRF